MPDKLGVFNETLRLIKEPLLTSVNQDDKLAREMRAVFPAAAKASLESGSWNFATFREQLERAGTGPKFGYDYYYTKPGDWLRTVFISETGLPDDPLHDYTDEHGKIATNVNTVYMSFVSDTFIDRVGAWTQRFADYVSSDIAVRIAGLATSASQATMEDLKDERKIREGRALSFDAVQQPPRRLPRGRWSTANRRGRALNGDRGFR